MNQIQLFHSTGQRKIDNIICGLIGLFETVFPGRIRKVFTSRANKPGRIASPTVKPSATNCASCVAKLWLLRIIISLAIATICWPNCTLSGTHGIDKQSKTQSVGAKQKFPPLGG